MILRLAWIPYATVAKARRMVGAEIEAEEKDVVQEAWKPLEEQDIAGTSSPTENGEHIH
jgi:hypothetical protein